MFVYNYKPVIKWAGGKSKTLSQLSKYFPANFINYHEPFAGGAAVFFYLHAEIKNNNAKAYISDSIEEIINLYKMIRDNVEELIQEAVKHVYKEDYYYYIRSLNPAELTDIQRASRILYLNKTCFNGLYRVNSKGQFNVSFGNYKNPIIVDRQALYNASQAFQLAELYSDDFKSVLQRAQKGDFVYLDLPYVPLSATSNFTGYTPGSFGPADHQRLKIVFAELKAKGCHVMMSNSNTDFVKELYSEFNIKTINAVRAINSDTSKRGSIKELVILSYPDSLINMSQVNYG